MLDLDDLDDLLEDAAESKPRAKPGQRAGTAKPGKAVKMDDDDDWGMDDFGAGPPSRKAAGGVAKSSSLGAGLGGARAGSAARLQE